jgi:hypothetical protein
MGYVDVAIPALAGLACAAFPRLMTRSSSPLVISRIRKIGYVLLGVAALFLFVKLSSR